MSLSAEAVRVRRCPRLSAETFADWGVDYLKYDYCDMARGR